MPGLEGVRVLGMVSAASAAKLIADFGADVIKIVEGRADMVPIASL